MKKNIFKIIWLPLTDYLFLKRCFFCFRVLILVILVQVSSFLSFRLNSYDIYLEILFARMIVFDEFIGSISITFVLVLLFVIIHNLNSK